jgi:LPPG:FO 2-phospho-L-lactate transferase
VGGKALKGPADRIMSSLGLEPSVYGVAKFYEDFIDHLIIDRADAGLRTRIKRLGLRVSVANTIMKDVESSVSLAAKVMAAK